MFSLLGDALMDEKKIEEQINKTRDLDSETSKPRIQEKMKAKKEEKKKESDNGKDQSPNKDDKNTKIPKTPQAEMQMVLTPFMRFPLTGVIRSDTSAFYPTPYNMYYIILLMDDVIRKNTYFKR